jgi:hypothetical protein
MGVRRSPETRMRYQTTLYYIPESSVFIVTTIKISSFKYKVSEIPEVEDNTKKLRITHIICALFVLVWPLKSRGA